MSTIVIRPIKPEDNHAIRDVINQCAVEYGLVGEGYGPSDEEVNSMYHSYDQPRSIYLVCELDGHILGGAGIAPFPEEGDHWCELRKMYLSPPGRGRGLGQQLLVELLHHALNLNFTACYLETTAVLSEALELYLKNGFKKLAEPLGNTGHSACEIPMGMNPISQSIKG